ncbi:glycosyltransferase family 2 protein [Shewanella algae]|uniref:glycosyltransferase family 2 protein n=1 Tax=Shewanella algae TaxID=38313 RepID=UPI000D14ED30|nr:glycosyltransferase [Shewanella algae]PST65933.1 hypothetical protein AYI77_16645 [Shewanella algae]
MVNPEVSVVLPVFNAENFIGEAINSILNQSFNNFELIIINDGSSDNSLQVLEKYTSDPRVRIVNQKNKGLVYSLNIAISMARGKYIARMDADDICLPNRLEEQVKYIKKYNLDVVGSWVQVFDDSGYFEILSFPEKEIDNKYTLLFKSSLAHPSVLIKKQVFDLVCYRDDELCEDYDLWCQCILNDMKIGNVPKILLNYRRHDNQITTRKEKALFESLDRVRLNYAQKLDDSIYRLMLSEKELHNNANYKVFKKVIFDLHELLINSNVSNGALYDILKCFYINVTPKSPILYLHFYKYMSRYNQSFWSERILFYRSLVFLSRDSKIYKIISKVYKWVS